MCTLIDGQHNHAHSTQVRLKRSFFKNFQALFYRSEFRSPSLEITLLSLWFTTDLDIKSKYWTEFRKPLSLGRALFVTNKSKRWLHSVTKVFLGHYDAAGVCGISSTEVFGFSSVGFEFASADFSASSAVSGLL